MIRILIDKRLWKRAPFDPVVRGGTRNERHVWKESPAAASDRGQNTKTMSSIDPIRETLAAAVHYGQPIFLTKVGEQCHK